MKLHSRATSRLRAIERELRQSEPPLAEMLTGFAALNEGADICSPEQPHRSAGLCVLARRQLSRMAHALVVSSAAAVGFAEPVQTPEQ
jgi:hypothetical protein